MTLLGAALLLVRALPAEVASGFAGLLVVSYVLFRPTYRREIAHNLRLVCGCASRLFWVRNAWRVGRNLSLMARLDTRGVQELVDRADVWVDNSTRQLLEQDLHVLMFSIHFGVWEILPQVFARRGWNVGLVAAPQKDVVVARVVRRLRHSGGVRVMADIRELMEFLMRPGVTGFMLDNTTRGSQGYVKVDSFLLRYPKLGFALARRYHHRAVPIWGYLERGRLKVFVGYPGGITDVVMQLLRQVHVRPEDWVFWGKVGALKEAE